MRTGPLPFGEHREAAHTPCTRSPIHPPTFRHPSLPAAAFNDWNHADQRRATEGAADEKGNPGVSKIKPVTFKVKHHYFFRDKYSLFNLQKLPFSP